MPHVVEASTVDRGDRRRERAPADARARSLSGEKAQRIIDAMRRSVAQRGTAGSTFDHVSREAGVSRGLLHYYFGTKEQLLGGGGQARLRAAPGAARAPAVDRQDAPTTSST